MKNKQLLPSAHIFRLVAVVIFVISFLEFSGCNRPNNDSKDWLNLSIKFKDNTPAAIRQASLNAIEKSIMDTINKLRSTYKEFNPSISRIQISVTDSQRFTIKVTTSMIDSMPTICTCSTHCQICRIAKEMFIPSASTPEFSIGDYIETVDTDLDKSKGDPAKK